MYNVRGSQIFKNWNKVCYIATRNEEQVEYDDYGNELNKYNKPEKFYFNIQPANGYLDIVTYGEKVEKMYRAIIPYEKYNGKFKEGDIVYLEGATPEGEVEATYGMNGNFKIYTVRPQNTMITMYFERIQK